MQFKKKKTKNTQSIILFCFVVALRSRCIVTVLPPTPPQPQLVAPVLFPDTTWTNTTCPTAALGTGQRLCPCPWEQTASFFYLFFSFPPSSYFVLRQMWWPAWSLKGKRNRTSGTWCCLEMLLVVNLGDSFSLLVCPSGVRGCSILPGLYRVYCREQCSRASR